MEEGSKSIPSLALESVSSDSKQLWILQPSGGGLNETQPVSLSSKFFDLHTHVIAHMLHNSHICTYIHTKLIEFLKSWILLAEGIIKSL